MLDLKAIHWTLSQESDYTICTKNLLFFIRTNYSNLKKQDISAFLFEFIFNKIQKDNETSKWNQKSNNIKEYQCTDILINYFETETDSYMRQTLFDCIFIDNTLIIDTDHMLRVLLSLAVSVQAKCTLECFVKLIKLNLKTPKTNELFQQLLNDQFGLINHQNETSLDDLAQITPLFTTFFINLSLDLILTHKFPDHLVSNFMRTLISWLKCSGLIVTLLNEKHFNVLQSIFYLTYVYPLDVQASQDGKEQKYYADLNILYLKLIQVYTDDILQNIPTQSVIDVTCLREIKVKFERNPNKVYFKRLIYILELFIHKSLVDFKRDHLKQLFKSLEQEHDLRIEFFI